jgi:hypothetical protein
MACITQKQKTASFHYHEIVLPISVGNHHIELEYFEAGELAVLDVSIVPE